MKFSRAAFAAAVAAAPLAFAAVAAQHARTAPPPPPPPPPQVTLALDTTSPEHWVLKLTNTAIEPVRIVADPRLFSFDVTVSGHTHHCTLPAEMVPTTDTERTLVVPGSRSWTLRVDPLLYCFGTAQAALLTAGATVTANFGWSAARYAPPFAIAPISSDAGVGPAKQISALPETIGATAALDGGPAVVSDAATVTSDAYPVRLKIVGPAWVDMSRAHEQSVTVTIINEGDRNVHTLITTPTIGFLVQDPRGIVLPCGADLAVSAIAELTSVLTPRSRSAVTIDIGATCGMLMRHPGLYRIKPLLDTRHTTPPVGATSFWTGRVVGETMLVRVRTGDDPLPASRLDPPSP